MKNRYKVQREIAGGNPWYISEQLQNLRNQSQRRTIERRWSFINTCIEKMHFLHPERKLRILDAGCGDGINLTILSKIPYARVTACDYNPLRLDRTRKAFLNVEVIEQNLTNVQMAKDSFDIILCSQVLEHIREDMVVLGELKRILSEDGVLIIGVPNEGCFLAKLRNRVLEPHICKTTDHVHFYTEKEFVEKLNSAGFSVRDRFYENFFFPKQSINNYFASREWGLKFMNILQKILPSQAAGFYFAAMHSDGGIETQRRHK